MFLNNSLGNELSTGNKFVDLLGGGSTGFADAFDKKGYYFPMFNYQGNGLARGGVQYFANPDYTNTADAAQMISSSLSKRADGETNNKSSLFNALGRLSTLGGKIGNWASEQRGKIMPDGKLRFEEMFSKLGDFGNYGRVNRPYGTNDRIV